MNDQLRNQLKQLKVDVEVGEEHYGDAFEEQLKRFLNGYDFMRLGQAVNGKHWESAAMCTRRMSIEAEKLGMVCFNRQLFGIRQSIAGKDAREVKNILSRMIVHRIRIQDVLRGN